MSATPKPDIFGEVSATLFELLHMEIVLYFQSSLENEGIGEVLEKLDSMGFRVGHSVCELLMKDEIRYMKDDKDTVPGKIMKFLARTLWPYLFNCKQPSLKSNKRDIWVIDDPNFKLLERISSSEQYKDQAKLVCFFIYKM